MNLIIKYFLLLLYCLIFYSSCSESRKVSSVEVNQDILIKYFNKSNIVLLSCVRCGCFVDLMNTLSKEEKLILQPYAIATDTNCNKISLQAIHIPQKVIDSISQDIYNITLIKKIGSVYDVRIIQTKEMRKTINIIKQYFKE